MLATKCCIRILNALCFNTTYLWYIDALSELIDVLQRSLDTVKDGAHDARPELDGERLAGPEDRVAHCHAACLLINLKSNCLK